MADGDKRQAVPKSLSYSQMKSLKVGLLEKYKIAYLQNIQ